MFYPTECKVTSFSDFFLWIFSIEEIIFLTEEDVKSKILIIKIYFWEKFFLSTDLVSYVLWYTARRKSKNERKVILKGWERSNEL